MKELNQKLATIQTELKAKKSSYNSFGKYYFRKAEDILEAIKPFLLKHNVTVTINEELVIIESINAPMLKSTATISDCDKNSAKEIAKKLNIEGSGAYVRVSQLKKQAVDKLIENVDHSQVIDFL